jgi:4-carboxymuconolactone decarboxylase
MSPTEAAADDMLENGMRVRRQVLGDAYVDAALASQDSMTEAFQPFMTSLRERSLLVIAMTAALGRMTELEIHTRGALRNGVTPDQLIAVLKQVTVYCGVPAGVGALKAMRGVVADFDAQENARS